MNEGWVALGDSKFERWCSEAYVGEGGGVPTRPETHNSWGKNVENVNTDSPYTGDHPTTMDVSKNTSIIDWLFIVNRSQLGSPA